MVFRLRKLNDIAKTNVKAIDKTKKHMTEEERKEAMEASTNYYKNADKPGSLASKAAMVAKYNESQKNRGINRYGVQRVYWKNS